MLHDSKRHAKRNVPMAGFTLMELMVVLTISAVLMAIAIPNVQRITQVLRISGDLRDLNGTVSQAKMNAAADFTHARARANLAANTFQAEIWNKAGNAGAGCWQTLGDGVNPCTGAASPVQQLSAGVTFGFDKLGTPPANTQAALGQAAACNNGPAGIVGAPAGVIAGTACIEFNSRGIPIDAAGNPTAQGAFYINNGTMVYGLTVAATGNALNWSVADASGSNASWKHQ